MNAVSMQPVVNILPDGLTLRGRFIDGKISKGGPDGKGGNYPDKFEISILSGDRTVRVEYPTEKAAIAAMSEFSDDEKSLPVELTYVAFPVGVRSAKGYTFFYGRRVE